MGLLFTQGVFSGLLRVDSKVNDTREGAEVRAGMIFFLLALSVFSSMMKAASGVF